MTSNILLSITIPYLAGICSPGPSMALIIKNGSLPDYKKKYLCVLGIVLGISLQSAVSLFSINLIQENIFLQTLIKNICGMYLCFIGIQNSLFTKKTSFELKKTNTNYFFQGFIIEVFNPLALGFFISLFGVNIESFKELYVKLFFWGLIVLLAAIWFSLLSIFTERIFKKYIIEHESIIKKLFGIVLIFFSIKIILIQ